ncbi:MAG: exonuclease SbcCD subunit D [Nanoarchaeota archaeon]|nr:exonuclease SbcCD subunit D [Nanoarchaeota archaeon]
MKFAHFSDIHIGGWRDEKMKVMSVQAFKTATQECIAQHVDFILIAGDLFDTALPQIDLIRDVAATLKQLKDADIPVYLIPGSHDFSPSGKTMIEVLEKAGLCHNVFKLKDNQLQFTIDKKTGVKLTGILGLACGLDKNIYAQLKKEPLEQEEGFKIFLFHTIIDEYKPKHLELVNGEPLNNLPKNFKYYAGGHPHYVFHKQEPSHGLVAYPGALFPNNFQELETFKGGGYYIVDEQLNIKHHFLQPKKVKTYTINVEEKTPEEAESLIIEKIRDNNQDHIVTIRIQGKLKQGKTSDINWKNISQQQGPYHVLFNKAKLTDQEEQLLAITDNLDNIEETLLTMSTNKDVNQQLLTILTTEKDEGEKNHDYELRVITDFIQKLQLEEHWT